MNKIKLWDELMDAFCSIESTPEFRKLLKQFAPEGYYTNIKGANDLTRFLDAMESEYMRHYPKQGDSWKTASISHLNNLLLKSMNEALANGVLGNPDHLLDIANFSAFLWMRLEELRAWKTSKDPE